MIVDDFGIQIENICDQKYLPPYYIRNISDTNIFLQAVDVLTGLVGFALRKENKLSRKNEARNKVLEVLELQIGSKITTKLTKKYRKGYFSVWVIDFGKSHGH